VTLSRTAKLVLVLALVLTVPLKFVLPGNARVSREDDLSAPVSAFLARHGFQPRVEHKLAGLFIHATAGDCRILIREAAAQGWNRDSIDAVARQVGRVTFVFDGSIHNEQPVVRTTLSFYWHRLRAQMGLKPARHPVLAVAASERCAIEALPWREVGEIS
jgi:hypothetical protein